jgi:hypothetical protein
MAEEASAEALHDQGSEKWLEQVLPLIRIRKRRPWTFFPIMHEVVGLYPSEIVVIRKKISTPISESAYMADGAGVLKEIGSKAGRVTSILFDEVSQVISHRRAMIGKGDTFKAVAGKKQISFLVLPPETPNVYRALRLLFGTRFQENARIPLAGLYWALSFFLLSLFFTFFSQQVTTILPMIGSSLDVKDLADLMPFILCVAFMVLICAIGYAIPGRVKTKAKTKLKPLQDLSSRQPLRSRIAGRTLTIAGSLLVLFVLGQQVITDPKESYLLFICGATGYAEAGSATILVMVLFFIAGIITDAVALFQTPGSETFYQLLARVSPCLGIVLIEIGRRMVSRNALSVLSQDSRAPILYLRSFESDVEDTLTPHRLLSRLFGLTMPPDVRRLPIY